jgi:hypothetical protein
MTNTVANICEGCRQACVPVADYEPRIICWRCDSTREAFDERAAITPTTRPCGPSSMTVLFTQLRAEFPHLARSA